MFCQEYLFSAKIARLFTSRGFKTFSYDPFYIHLKPSIPVYPRLQFILKAYDFPSLESYERFANTALRRWAKNIDSFPHPPKKTQYKIYHPNSTKVKTEFELNYYCRIVNADNIRTIDLPLIFDFLQQSLPEGVELTIQEYDQQLEDDRYVTNLEVETLQGELEKLTSK